MSLDTLSEKVWLYGLVKERIKRLKEIESEEGSINSDLRDEIALALQILDRIRSELYYSMSPSAFKEEVFSDWVRRKVEAVRD